MSAAAPAVAAAEIPAEAKPLSETEQATFDGERDERKKNDVDARRRWRVEAKKRKTFFFFFFPFPFFFPFHPLPSPLQLSRNCWASVPWTI
jgi:hypothetical protein